MTDARASDPVAPASVDGGVWAPHRRRLTLGLVLTITLVAFESLAISTVLPVVSDDLGGLGLYGWVFSALLPRQPPRDRHRRAAGRPPRHGSPFTLGLVLFAGGLVVGGLAPSMGVLVAARVGQGIGAGAIPAVAYTSVGRAYPPALRPRVFAVFSSAWVIPGLLGPAASSGIAHALGLAGGVPRPAPARGPGRRHHRAGAGPLGRAPDPGAARRRRRARAHRSRALALIAGVAAVLVAVGGMPRGRGRGAGGGGRAAGGRRPSCGSCRRGTLRLAPGIPAAVAVKGS